MSTRITIDLTREHGGYQLSINEVDDDGAGHGYRIFGPKFSGGSETLRTVTLDDRDVEMIRSYLDRYNEIARGNQQ